MNHKVNPNWVNAPQEVMFLISVPHLRARWSRKRRLKWKRRFVRRVLPKRVLYDLHFGYEQPCWCEKSSGLRGVPHVANCAEANWN